MNELVMNNISPSRDDVERLKRKCEQDLPHPIVPSVRPIFTQYCAVGRETALQNLLLPTNLEPISSCGVPVATLNTFPLDSPRNYPYSDLYFSPADDGVKKPLPELSELLNILTQFGDLELQVTFPTFSLMIGHYSLNFYVLHLHNFQSQIVSSVGCTIIPVIHFCGIQCQGIDYISITH